MGKGMDKKGICIGTAVEPTHYCGCATATNWLCVAMKNLQCCDGSSERYFLVTALPSECMPTAMTIVHACTSLGL